jgi:hypothetical protein
VDNFWRGAALSAAGYALVATVFLLPGAIRAGGGIPGSPRSDLWDSLWGLWHFLAVHGSWHTTLLDPPQGGWVPPADPVNILLAAPLTLTVGPAIAWTVLVFGHFVFAGLATERLACVRGIGRIGAFTSGVAYAGSALWLSHVHNGTSESIGIGWLPLALLAMDGAKSPKRVALAAAAVAVAVLSSPYLGVAVALAGAIEALGRRSRPAALALGLGLVVAAPWYVAMGFVLRWPDNLVGIKDPHEVALVRRTIGAADPLTFVWPGGWRSPDFRRISRYGEDYLHAPYLGLTWMVAALFVGWRREILWVVVGVVLACGPVLVHDGTAILLPGNLGIPLPYLLIERLPGFGSLSLVYRLAILAQLGLALLAGRAVSRLGPAVLIVGTLEVLLLSPLRLGPDWARPTSGAPFSAIDAPGAVVNWPVVGGRDYLYEGALHRHPIAGSLNFPANLASRELFATMRDRPAEVDAVAARHGLGWLVVHDDVDAPPGPEDAGLRAFIATRAPVSSADGVRVYRIGGK